MPTRPLTMYRAVSWPSCRCACARPPGGIVIRCRQIPRAPALSVEIPAKFSRPCAVATRSPGRTTTHAWLVGSIRRSLVGPVLLPYEPEALQGQLGVDLRDRLRVRRD